MRLKRLPPGLLAQRAWLPTLALHYRHVPHYAVQLVFPAQVSDEGEAAYYRAATSKELSMFGIDFRIARIVWTVAVIGLLLYVVYAMRATLLVLVFSVFFSYLVYPVVQLTERRVGPRVPRNVVTAVVFAMVLGIIVLAVTAFGTRIADEATRLGQELPKLLNAQTIVDRIPLPRFMEPLRGRLQLVVQDLLHSGSGQVLPYAKYIGGGLLQAATNLIYIIVVPILSFLLIKDARLFKAQLLSWTDSSNFRFWASILEELNLLLSRYVRALLLLSLATFTSYSIALSLMGAPFALLLAGIAAALEVIPVFGPLFGAITILLLASFSGYGHVLWIAAFVVAYRVFQDYILNPYLMSEGVEVSPVLIVVGLLGGEELGGVAGIFLSVPVIAAAKIILQRIQCARADLSTGASSMQSAENNKARSSQEVSR